MNANITRTSRTFDILLLIAVVTLLGLILIPVQMGDGGRLLSTACLSNVKQLGLSNHVYAADNDDSFPPFYTFDSAHSTHQFKDVLKPYIHAYSKGPFVCREDEKNIANRSAEVIREGIPGDISYVHSLSLKGVIPNFAKGNRFMKLKEVESLADVAWLRDPIRGYGRGKDSNGKDVSNVFLGPHSSRFNVCYLDAHAKARNPIHQLKEL